MAKNLPTGRDPVASSTERQALVPELYAAGKCVGIDSPKVLFAELEGYFGRELLDGPRSLSAAEIRTAIAWLRSRAGGSNA